MSGPVPAPVPDDLHERLAAEVVLLREREAELRDLLTDSNMVLARALDAVHITSPWKRELRDQMREAIGANSRYLEDTRRR